MFILKVLAAWASVKKDQGWFPSQLLGSKPGIIIIINFALYKEWEQFYSG